MAGFSKVFQTEIILNINDRLSVNLTLKVGQANEQVNVESNVTQVELQRLLSSCEHGGSNQIGTM